MIRSTFILFFSFVTTIHLVQAQEPSTRSGNIEGIVVDRTTQSPIPGATVAVVGTTRGAATNASGEFRIEGLPVGGISIGSQFRRF